MMKTPLLIFFILLTNLSFGQINLRSLGPNNPSNLEVPSAAVTAELATANARPTSQWQIGDEIIGPSTMNEYKWNGVTFVYVGNINGTPVPTTAPTATTTATTTSTSTFVVVNTPVNTNTPWNTPTPTSTFTATQTWTGTITPSPTPLIPTAVSSSNYCGNPRLIIAGVDSLTLSTYSDYLDFLITDLKSEYSDGGPGFFPLDYTNQQYYGFSFSFDSSGTQLGGTFTTVPAIYSINSFAVTWQGASNGWFTIQPTPAGARGPSFSNQPIYPQTYDYARHFYLQQPGGGTFIFNTGGSLASNAVTVNTNGTLNIEYVELPGNPANNAVSCTAITGNVCFFGDLFYNKTGVMVNCIGWPGSHVMGAWSALNATTWARWMQLLRPNYWLLNGGRNDSGSGVSGGQLTYYYNSLINEIHNGWPGCNVLQIVPNRDADPDTYIEQYKELFINNWENGLAGFIDNDVAMGTYEQSVTWVEMTASSNPHPVYYGSRNIADNIAKKIDLNQNPGRLSASIWGTQQYLMNTKGDLNEHTFEFPVTMTVPQKVLEFGLANNAQQTVMIHLILTSNLDGTYLVNKTTVDLTAQNIFALTGCVSSYTTGNPVVVLQNSDSNGGLLNYTFSYDVNSNNRMEVWVTPSTTSTLSTTHFCKVSVTGDWTVASNFTGSVAYATPTPAIPGPPIFQTY